MSGILGSVIGILLTAGVLVAVTVPIQHTTTAVFNTTECYPCTAPQQGCCPPPTTSTVATTTTTAPPTTTTTANPPTTTAGARK